MPTGYTSDIYDGKPVTFRQFALDCARAFGALIMMRDEPKETPIKLNEVASFYIENVARDEARMAELKNLSLEQVKQRASEGYAEQLARYNERVATNQAIEKRYLDMLEQAKNWKAPTSDHEGHRDFMIEQLERAMQFDVYTPDAPIEKTPHEWFVEEIESAKQSLEYSKSSLAEEKKRVADRNKWITDLLEALPQP